MFQQTTLPVTPSRMSTSSADRGGMQRSPVIRELPFFCLMFLFKSTLGCLAHVIQLGNLDLMKHVTNIGAIETAATIWEWDPTAPDNRLSNGSLDAVSTLRTIAVKVCINYSVSQ